MLMEWGKERKIGGIEIKTNAFLLLGFGHIYLTRYDPTLLSIFLRDIWKTLGGDNRKTTTMIWVQNLAVWGEWKG